MSNMDSIDIQVSASAQNANAELDNLIVKLGAVQKSLSSIGGKSTNFGTQMSRQINTTTKSVDSMSSSINKATKSTVSLVSAFGNLYAGIRGIVRGTKSLWGSIESSADYVEAFNYYTVTFGKVASKWDENWENYGSENARNYSNAFVTELNNTFEKLSGVSFDSQTGLLSETGLTNLGLNLQEVTEYAAQLGSMMDSVGHSGQTTLATTEAFVKLAGDMSSLRNIDYSTAGSKIRSVLQGQSRAGYEFGWDTTVASLQAMADRLDLSKAVSEMTQMEKQQLRILVILEQSRVAWGDQSNTINTFANQTRILRNNMSELSMMLGQLFVPILNKIMPIVNGVTIAIKNLMSSIAGFMGIEIKDTGYGFSGMEDEVGGVTDSLDQATASAKKFKGQLQGFDKLNVITTQSDSGTSSGGAGGGIDLTQQILDATAEYEKVWEEAFNRMENQAEVFAKKVEKALEPVKSLFQNIAIGDWFAVGQDATTIVVGITDFFSKAIANVDWQTLGNNIGLFLVGIDWTDVFLSLGELIGNTIEGLIEAYEWTFNVAPLETAIISAVGLLEFTPVGSIISKKIAQAIASTVGLEIAADAGIKSALVGVGGLMANTLNAGFQAMLGNKAALSALSFINPIIVNITGIASVIGGVGIAFTNFFDMLKDGFSWFNEILMVVGIGLTAVGAIILGAPALITAAVAGIVAAVGTLVVVIKDNWDSIVAWTSDLFDKVSGFFGDLWAKVSEIWSVVSTWFNDNVIQPVVNFFVGFATRVGQVFEGLWIIIQAVWKIVSTWFNDNVITPLVNFFSPIVTKISNFFIGLWNNIKSVWNTVANWFSTNIATPVANAFKTACDKIGGFFTSLWSGIKRGVVSAMNGVIGGIESAINFIVNGINKIIKGFNKIVSWAAEVAEVDWGGVDTIPKVTLSRVSCYAAGGFPEDGWFRASKGEYFGKFDDGTSYIANNHQITSGVASGVASAVRDANAEQNALLREQNALLRQILAKDTGISTRDVFEAVRAENRDYINRNGESAFAF